jgi:hypothetical protein
MSEVETSKKKTIKTRKKSQKSGEPDAREPRQTLKTPTSLDPLTLSSDNVN